MPPERHIPPAKAAKTERTHEENQERAYIAASRRSDRSLEARVESARRASAIHQRRTGRGLRVTEQDVVDEAMYEEEDADLPGPYRRLTAHLQTDSADFNRRLGAYLTHQIAMRSALGQGIIDAYAEGVQNGQFPPHGQPPPVFPSPLRAHPPPPPRPAASRHAPYPSARAPQASPGRVSPQNTCNVPSPTHDHGGGPSGTGTGAGPRRVDAFSLQLPRESQQLLAGATLRPDGSVAALMMMQGRDRTPGPLLPPPPMYPPAAAGLNATLCVAPGALDTQPRSDDDTGWHGYTSSDSFFEQAIDWSGGEPTPLGTPGGAAGAAGGDLWTTFIENDRWEAPTRSQ